MRGISGRGDTEAEARSVLGIVESPVPTQEHKARGGARWGSGVQEKKAGRDKSKGKAEGHRAYRALNPLLRSLACMGLVFIFHFSLKT